MVDRRYTDTIVINIPEHLFGHGYILINLGYNFRFDMLFINVNSHNKSNILLLYEWNKSLYVYCAFANYF